MAEHADASWRYDGIGTQFFEVWTWRQLGYHDKPVGLLNLDGFFYDSLLSF
jgi:predicted Rossmann-fold nucleotide-binding protein